MFSGWGKSRNYRISGGGPTLTDVLVVFYCFLQSVPIDHSKGNKNSREGGLGSPIFYLFCWCVGSLRPIINLSVIKGRVFLG